MAGFESGWVFLIFRFSAKTWVAGVELRGHTQAPGTHSSRCFSLIGDLRYTPRSGSWPIAREGFLVVIGPIEILVVVLALLCAVVVPTIAIVLVIFISRSRKWSAPETTGTAVSVRRFDDSDKPISRNAVWHGDELQVDAHEAATVSLFEVPVSGLEQCMITYRFRIQCDALERAVYPEMWCRIPEKGRFFSRGLDRKVRGPVDWQLVEIPFYLNEGQRPDLLELNLVFEGRGSVRLKDIEILSTPLKKAV